MLMKLTPGVDFTNIFTCSFCVPRFQKRKNWQLDCLSMFSIQFKPILRRFCLMRVRRTLLGTVIFTDIDYASELNQREITVLFKWIWQSAFTCHFNIWTVWYSLYRKDRLNHLVSLSLSYIVKRSILFGQGNIKCKLCEIETKTQSYESFMHHISVNIMHEIRCQN